MPAFIKTCTTILAIFAATATALNGIVTPSSIKAGEDFEITFQNANDDDFRLYLAASLADSNGPTCYLVNSTTVNSPLNLSIPAGVGPSANYYSIAIADLTSSQGATYSNRFNLTDATGNYTEYENKLDGSPFWSADDLPCTAYSCARECAMKSYPEDLTETDAYDNMKECILRCDGVTAAASQTAPAQASATASRSTSDDATSTEAGAAATSSVSAGNKNFVFASVAAAGFGALACLL